MIAVTVVSMPLWVEDPLEDVTQTTFSGPPLRPTRAERLGEVERSMKLLTWRDPAAAAP
jgi:hypothetical protein